MLRRPLLNPLHSYRLEQRRIHKRDQIRICLVGRRYSLGFYPLRRKFRSDAYTLPACQIRYEENSGGNNKLIDIIAQKANTVL